MKKGEVFERQRQTYSFASKNNFSSDICILSLYSKLHVIAFIFVWLCLFTYRKPDASSTVNLKVEKQKIIYPNTYPNVLDNISKYSKEV